MKNIFYFNTRNKFPMKYENKFFDLAQGQGFQKNVRLKQKQENKCRFSRFATYKSVISYSGAVMLKDNTETSAT